MISGVSVVPLEQIATKRGSVYHMMRNDSPYFSKFGEIYFSVTNPNEVKAWKKHRDMTQNITCPSGAMRFVLYDGREGSETEGQINEIALSDSDYKLLIIPPGIWYGFTCVSEFPALIANCSDIPHDPEEVERLKLPQTPIPYQW